MKQRPANDKSFQICQRVLHKCHEIIFEDIPSQVIGPYSSSLKIHNRVQSARKRVNHHVEPAIIGIACILGSVPGMPSLSEIYGSVAVEQGRVDDDNTNPRRQIAHEDASAPTGIGPSQSNTSQEDVEEDDAEEADEQPEGAQQATMSSLFFTVIPPEGSDDIKARPNAPRRMTVGAAKTLPSLTSPEVPVSLRRSALSNDPFSQAESRASPYQSSPSVLPSKRSSSLGTDVLPDFVLTQYDDATKRRLLQSHYCQSEVDMNAC